MPANKNKIWSGLNGGPVVFLIPERNHCDIRQEYIHLSLINSVIINLSDFVSSSNNAGAKHTQEKHL